MAKITVVAEKWGNCIRVIFPKDFVVKEGIKPGQKLEVDFTIPKSA
jgi:antitoxin component of MazEF toxin-antitoxin module